MIKLEKYFSRIRNLMEQHPTIVATVFFLMLTFLFTFPLGIHFSSQVPNGDGDAYQAFSNIELHSKALVGLDFFAQGKLLLSDLGTYSPYAFLSLFLNKYAVYNTMFFLSYVLSGLGAYLLAYYFTKRRGASLVAGVLFAFAPFHYYQTVAVHLGSMQQQWIPFAALFLLKFLDKFKFKDYLLFLFFLFMLAISEHQMLAFSLLFFLTLIFVRIWQDKELLKNKKLWIYLGSSLFFFALVVFFVFGDLLKVATSENNFLDPGMGAAKKYAMNAWEPLLLPAFHSIWPEINEWLRKTVKISADWRDSYFVGLSTLILLAVFAWQKLRRKNKLVLEKAEEQGLKLWLITFLVMYIFAWGPGFKLFNFDFPLPYYLVYKFLPFYENIRVTGRLFMFAMLALAIVTSFAIKYLQPKMKENFWKKNFVGVIVFVVMLEFWVGPLKTMSLDHSPFYDRLASEQGSFKILEIPGSTDYDFASYKMLTNNAHNKQSLDGMPLARKNEGQFDFQQTTPILKQLLYTLPKGNNPETKEAEDILRTDNFANATDILNYYNVKYITISKKYTDDKMRKNTDEFIRKYIELDGVYEDEYLVAYNVSVKQPSGYYVKLNTDNGQLSLATEPRGEEYFARKLGSGAELEIFNMGKDQISASLDIEAKSPENYKMVIVLPDGKRKEINLAADFKTENVSFVLAAGINKIKFELFDSSGKEIMLNEKAKGGALVKEISIKNKTEK
ncbi:MAG TPA: hypothetical protein DEA43_03570 [Candidatus Moranbacteria bacterium]|nr:hypothetical protein [Candidatus Moranbacteria bacterium]HBT45935.1 hypothetical protein [Candidatus Moranbacteria bacterium]